jgi:lipopolysaccharide transport protein LptA
MNRLPYLSLLFCFLLPAAFCRAQDVNDSDTNAPPGSTIITSDELHSDQATHTSVFTGNVLVTGTNFTLTCLEMTVIFDKDNKIEHIIATGGVVINQPDRVTHSDQADYYKADDKFVLTGRPVIVDHKNQLSAPVITIYRTTQQLITSGSGKTTFILPPSSTSSPTTPPAASP